jgi:hypothetical protein
MLDIIWVAQLEHWLREFGRRLPAHHLLDFARTRDIAGILEREVSHFEIFPTWLDRHRPRQERILGIVNVSRFRDRNPLDRISFIDHPKKSSDFDLDRGIS